MNTITIQVSSNDVYWGYRYILPSDEVKLENKENIILGLKKNMKSFFKERNLLRLAEGVDKLNLHMHFQPESLIVYVCDAVHL